jgi:hypothetical protein
MYPYHITLTVRDYVLIRYQDTFSIDIEECDEMAILLLKLFFHVLTACLLSPDLAIIFKENSVTYLCNMFV